MTDAGPVRCCSHCGVSKPWDFVNFYAANTSGPKKPGSICKTCGINNSREYRVKQDEKDSHLSPKPSHDAARSSRRDSAAYKVVSDPDPIAGFRPGALLASAEVKNMLPTARFDIGTVLEYHGQRFVVEPGECGQRLRALAH
jgi:hypothetical protein